MWFCKILYYWESKLHGVYAHSCLSTPQTACSLSGRTFCLNWSWMQYFRQNNDRRKWPSDLQNSASLRGLIGQKSVDCSLPVHLNYVLLRYNFVSVYRLLHYTVETAMTWLRPTLCFKSMPCWLCLLRNAQTWILWTFFKPNSLYSSLV